MLILSALLLALFIDRVLNFESKVIVAHWFSRYITFITFYINRSDALTKHGFSSLTLLLFPLILVIYWVSLFGFATLGQFIVSTVLIWLALGTIDSATVVNLYQKGHPNLQTLTPLLAKSQETLANENEEAVARLVFWQALQSTFGVIFWLVLGGPSVALLYTFLSLLNTQGIAAPLNVALRNAAAKLHVIIDWLPARLFSLTLLLISDGKANRRVWWNNVNAKSDTLINLCGMRGLKSMPTSGSLPQRALDRVNRSLFAWLVLITLVAVI